MTAGPRLDTSRMAGWLLAAAVMVVGLHAALDAVWDADLWWILRAGRDLVAEHAVPTLNRYAFTEPMHPWVMHEWLFAFVYATLDRIGGLGAVALVRVFALGVTTVALTARSVRDARPLTAAVCVGLALVLFGGRFGSPRPVGMMVALASMTVALAFEPTFDRRHALALGAASLVWTNAHGSFPLGVFIAVLGCALPEHRRVRAMGALLSAVVTLVNPYGLGLHRLALRYVLGQRDDAVAVVHQRVLEWWPLARAPLRVATVPELVVLGVLTLVWLRCLGDARWRPRAVLGLALAGMAWQHNRHLQLAGLLGLTLAAGPVDAWLGGQGPVVGALRRMLPSVVGALALTVVLWAGAWATRSRGQWTDVTQDDEDLAAIVRRLPADARVFTTLPYTGYVLGLGRAVYWDTRNDCYGREVLEEGFDLSDGRMDARTADRVLRLRGTTHVVVPCHSPTAQRLTGWSVTARSGAFCVYQPR